MSGTSLDGVDIACCTFSFEGKYSFSIDHAETIPYSSEWAKKLKNAHKLPSGDLLILDSVYGKFLGERCRDFIKRNKIRNVDFISSHGHTVFHQPAKRMTFQLGNANALHAAAGLPVIYDFRSLDVALGGEGAPLVPVGDKFLFNEFDVCLNLGGIANLSQDIKGNREAYDICFCNMALNYLISSVRKQFDKGGRMAASGEINKPLLNKLNKVYSQWQTKRPSLGRELFEKKIKPLLDNRSVSLKDKLATVTESAAIEISYAILAKNKNPRVLCTGGGTFNSFLISRILEHCGDEATLVIPDDEVVNFKEAIVFAFLGVLRARGDINCLKTVTGASRNSSAGLMIGNFEFLKSKT